MASRRTQPGASANARRATSKKGARTASSTRSRSSSAGASSRAKTATPRRRAANDATCAPDRGRWYLLPLLVVVALVIFTWTYYPVARVQYRETREKQRLQAELTSLRARNARLRASVDRLKTPEGVEDYARSQLGMAKKGEHVLVVLDGDEAAPASPTPPATRIDSDETSEPAPGPWTAFLDTVFRVE